MSLYIIPVDPPGAGTDWQYTVPGQYLEHIVGITATLTAGGGTVTTAVDSSPNGNDATYQNPGITFGVAGLVAGDTAIETSNSSVFAVQASPIPGWLDTGDCWFNFWVDPAADPFNNIRYAYAFNGANTNLAIYGLTYGSAWRYEFGWGVTTGHDFASVLPTVTAGRHMFTVTFQRGSGSGSNVAFYMDGVQVDVTQHLTDDGPVSDYTLLRFARRVGGTNTWDEMAFGTGLPSAGDVAALYVAASVDFATYSAAQLAFGATVEGYYHLDEQGIGPQRQVVLDVTDGTHLTVEVPTGFPEAATAAPYTYSWQPNLNSGSQTPDGTVTTIAIPDLILPAGYTLGTRTLDLGASDQWSDINIWWSTDVMDASTFFNPYEYPPGVTLTTRPVGAAP